MKDVIVIGAGCAGMTAAVYALRAGKSVLILEGEGIGGQISFAPRVENFPSIASISGAEFSNNLFEQVVALGAEVELETVTKIIPGEDRHVVKTDSGEHACKSVVIATGVKHRHLGIAREHELAGISYCAICDGAFYKGRRVAVVGGGNSALQSAEFLAAYCEKVFLIHRRSAFRAEQSQVAALLKIPNVELVLDSVLTALEGEGELAAVQGQNVQTGEFFRLDAGGLFVTIGQIPENAVFKGLIALDADGYIDAGEDCHTNVPGVFAAGDCRKKEIRQLTTAAADGAVAGLAAAKYRS
ncbi:MAG: FAD-dependent oxidoreductase [Oscillospiraceae bacterium]|jgi:thioredoxin reductase (NADPH)|nr:FAD-dependent oxidoreductase [Oscillospiraceae bacterium]